MTHDNNSQRSSSSSEPPSSPREQENYQRNDNGDFFFEDVDGEDDICQCCMRCCSYPNGRQAILFSQVLLLIGILFGVAAIFDCSFVQVWRDDLEANEAWINMMAAAAASSSAAPSTSGAKVGLGFITHQDEMGNCQMPEHYDAYGLFLGSNWCLGKFLGGVVGLGSALFIWSIWLGSLSCSAQPRAARNVLAFFIAVFTAATMAVTFAAFGSDLCNPSHANGLEHGCEFSVSAGYAVVATTLFLASGIVLHRGTKNYPDASAAIERKSLARQQQQQSATTSSSSASENDVEFLDENRTGDAVVWDGLGDAQEVPVDLSLVHATLGGEHAGGARTADEMTSPSCQSAARDEEAP